jgi:hypothetical protein
MRSKRWGHHYRSYRRAAVTINADGMGQVLERDNLPKLTITTV